MLPLARSLQPPLASLLFLQRTSEAPTSLCIFGSPFLGLCLPDVCLTSSLREKLSVAPLYTATPPHLQHSLSLFPGFLLLHSTYKHLTQELFICLFVIICLPLRPRPGCKLHESGDVLLFAAGSLVPRTVPGTWLVLGRC